MTRIERLRQRRADKRFVRILIVVTLALIVVRFVFFPIFSVPSDSMHPTAQEGDRVLVVRTENVHRGDVVVFHDTRGWLDDGG